VVTHEYAQAEYKAHTSAIMRMTIHTASKAIRCQSMRKKVPCPTISMVDHCQHGPAPQNSSVGSLNLLSCLPRSQSTTRKTISVLGSNQGPVHKHTSAVSGRCMYSTPEQRKAPAIYGTSYCRHLASNGHLFGEKNHERSKNSTPAIGISAVPARHKSESPWRNHGGLCRLHLLTLTWIMIPWAKWTLNSCH